MAISWCGEDLRLDYQDVEYNNEQETFRFGVVYRGKCDVLSVQLVQITDNSSDHVRRFTRSIYDESIVILGQYVGAQTYFRIVAMDYDDTVCTDYDSRHTFYKIVEQGKHIRTYHFRVH